MALLDADQCYRLTTYHATGQEWIAHLPTLVDEYTRRWQLSLGPTFRPGGDASWAALVTRADGTLAVLKIALPDSASEAALALLRLLDGDGTVRVLEHDPHQDATLMEFCEPGTFAAATPLAAADDAAIAVLPRLWGLSPALLPNLPLLTDVARQRGDTLRDRAVKLGDPLLQAGVDLWSALAADSASFCVLHGDANQRNVLRSTRGWLAIDPRPMLGDPCYDLATWVTTRLDEVDAPVERVTVLAERLDLRPHSALTWVAAQTLLLCSWLQQSGEPGPLDVYRRAARELIAAIS